MRFSPPSDQEQQTLRTELTGTRSAVEEILRRAAQVLGVLTQESNDNIADVIKLGIFVTDISILPVIREIRDRHVDTAHPPASTAVQIGALFRPGYVVEIEALAVID